MLNEKGQISINSQNIFPILKRWLYSERDIFVRELVSNATDAITKIKRIASLGEYNLQDNESLEIHIEVNEEAGTLSFCDNGVGMTADEVRKYLNQVAFSSAQDFLEKYKGADDSNQIIGHFGLGFYSAFMVSKKVTVDTLSWQKDAEPVCWSCDGDTEYTLEPGKREFRGTTVTLYLNTEDGEFLRASRVRAILDKYCAFLPYPIFLTNLNAYDEDKEKHETIEETSDTDTVTSPRPVNDTMPLWKKKPSDCTDEEYRAFYHKLFTDFQEPLFWVHLNADFPIRLQGILYFPRISNTMQTIEGKIMLFNNQVYVADNVKEVIPEYLMMLKGVIDCPDLPLNVSRSALQKDKEVQKIPAYISRKVADKLIGMHKTDISAYEKYWQDIRPFILYGCLRDEKFYDRMREYLIFKLSDGNFTTLEDYLAKAENSHKNTVYYASDARTQAAYIDTFTKYGLQVLILDNALDTPFIQFLESKAEGLSFSRVDSQLPQQAKESGEANAEDGLLLEAMFRRATGREQMAVRQELLSDPDSVAFIQLNEFVRRWQEMGMFSSNDREQAFQMIDQQIELVVNSNSPVIRTLIEREKASEPTDEICGQIFDLARLGAGLMHPNDLTSFVKRSQSMLNQSVK